MKDDKESPDDKVMCCGCLKWFLLGDACYDDGKMSVCGSCGNSNGVCDTCGTLGTEYDVNGLKFCDEVCELKSETLHG